MESQKYALCYLNQEDPFSRSCFITQNASESSFQSELSLQASSDNEPLSSGGDFGHLASKASQQMERSSLYFTTSDINKIQEALSPSLRSLCNNAHQFEQIMLSLKISPSQDELYQFKRLLTIQAQEVRREMVQSFILELMTKRISSLDELQDEQAVMAFSLFGKDTNGLITQAQFKNVMSELGTQISEEDLLSFWDRADSDGDGKISISDFKAILKEI